mmetsp:Transcript_91512/g.245080  ORF Transcript_91512/g.245080 Transcript_91512/m.245080 type:complete len:351 (-) Transcript_91512:1284-2336(-)
MPIANRPPKAMELRSDPGVPGPGLSTQARVRRRTGPDRSEDRPTIFKGRLPLRCDTSDAGVLARLRGREGGAGAAGSEICLSLSAVGVGGVAVGLVWGTLSSKLLRNSAPSWSRGSGIAAANIFSACSRGSTSSAGAASAVSIGNFRFFLGGGGGASSKAFSSFRSSDRPNKARASTIAGVSTVPTSTLPMVTSHLLGSCAGGSTISARSLAASSSSLVIFFLGSGAGGKNPRDSIAMLASATVCAAWVTDTINSVTPGKLSLTSTKVGLAMLCSSIIPISDRRIKEHFSFNFPSSMSMRWTSAEIAGFWIFCKDLKNTWYGMRPSPSSSIHSKSGMSHSSRPKFLVRRP